MGGEAPGGGTRGQGEGSGDVEGGVRGQDGAGTRHPVRGHPTDEPGGVRVDAEGHRGGRRRRGCQLQVRFQGGGHRGYPQRPRQKARRGRLHRRSPPRQRAGRRGGLPGWIREHAAGFVHPRPSVPRRRGRGTGGEAARSTPLASVAGCRRGGAREVSHERGDEPVPGDWTVRLHRRGSRRREDADDGGGDGQGDRAGGVGRDERREGRRERVRGVYRSRRGCLARRL
mmetsp:Transcript_3295/g.13384  ORF Transcript_3295/g.13384 Transcript_3295/m.13384 type:complete len:228 (-) Transcript_3295:84-767(-)